MFRFNPSVLLLAWGGALLLVIALPWPRVGMACAAVFLAGILFARSAMCRLLWRSRWLLAAVLLMFGWMTPGMAVSWLPGATRDGLQQGVEQLARLVNSIAMVAILLTRLDTPSLLSGFYGLLNPLRLFHVDVERLVLRLALTLRELDGSSNSAVKSEIICLPQRGLHVPDFVILGVLVLVLGGRWL